MEFYRAGRLTDAIAAATELVKSRPHELRHRVLLCELLCFTADFERADIHIDCMATQDPGAAYSLSVFRQFLRAEVRRRQFDTDARPPEFLTPPGTDVRARMAAFIESRSGSAEKAAEIVRIADLEAQPTSGRCDGAPFDDFRDLDDVFAPIVEVLTSVGDYYWIPIRDVVSLEFKKPETLKDLVWRQADIRAVDGTRGNVLIPALYPRSHLSPDSAVVLGRATDWNVIGGLTRGVGLRCFKVGDEERSIMEISRIEFERSAEGASS